jgi:hypothetical protein
VPARKAIVPTTVEAHWIGRYRQEIEAAVYFCGLEALQNVVKYAGASHAVGRLEKTDGAVEFSVADDGAGFDPEARPCSAGTANMADRLEALGGTLEVRSRPGEGTVIAGRIPARRTLLQIGGRYLRSYGHPPENGAHITRTSRSRGSDAVRGGYRRRWGRERTSEPPPSAGGSGAACSDRLLLREV